MSLESGEVRVGQTGHIYRAPLNSTLPTNISAALAAHVWVELGYTTEEGPRFTFGREVNEAMAWQSYDPLRVISARVPKEIAVDFMQFNQNTWATAMGGGTWTGADPNYEYTPPAEDEVDQFMYAVEFADDDYDYRFVFKKVQNMSGVEFALTRENPIVLPVTVKVLATDDGSRPFILQTNDPNMGAAAQAGS